MKDPYALWDKSEITRRKKFCDEDSRKIIDRCLKINPIKPYYVAELKNFRALDTLFKLHPNFTELLTFLRGIFLDCIASGVGFGSPNILLVGSPGIGKTHFMNALSEALGLSYMICSGGVLDDALTLVGTDPKYSGAAPGSLAMLVIESDDYNQLLLFDEIDKIGAEGSHPIMPVLLAMLEDETACQFRDNFFGAAFDLSGVSVVATANSISGLPPELLSRFLVFNIPDPTEQQLRAVAMMMLRDFRSTRLFLSEKVSKEFLDKCSTFLPRDLKKALAGAVGEALSVYCGKHGEEAIVDLAPGSIDLEPSYLKPAFSKIKIGF